MNPTPHTHDADGAPLRGITADVFRPADGSDCTNGGVSSRVKRVTIVGRGIPAVSPASEDAPAMMLRQDSIGDCIHLEPTGQPHWNRIPMFGGNFAFTCDSRLREVAGDGALRIFDRYE